MICETVSIVVGCNVKGGGGVGCVGEVSSGGLSGGVIALILSAMCCGFVCVSPWYFIVVGVDCGDILAGNMVWSIFHVRAESSLASVSSAA